MARKKKDNALTEGAITEVFKHTLKELPNTMIVPNIGTSYRGFNFSGNNFNGIKFVECDFTNAIFQGADFTDATFENCIFDNTDFRWAINAPKGLNVRYE